MVRVVGVFFYCFTYWFAFYLQLIAQIILHFSDIVVLNVTDRNGTEIASTKVMLYKCRTSKRYVHVRHNVFVLINQLIVINKEKGGDKAIYKKEKRLN